MAASVKRKFGLTVVLFLLLVLAGAFAFGYALVSDVEVAFAQIPGSADMIEATRKLKLLNEAQAAKRQGFIRLSEPEINSFLQNGFKSAGKDRTNATAQLVKAGVLLHQNDITFVTWHNAPVFGINLPFVWQRVLVPERSTNGWSLSVREMRVGKVPVPQEYWADVNRLLGSGDAAFAERKVWLSNIPTVMLTRNEISRSPELRLYSYVPVVKQEPSPFEIPEAMKTSAAGASNTLSANIRN